MDADLERAQPHAASTKPLLLAKVTGYRLLWTAVMVTFGSVKLTKSLEERKVIVTWLDGVLVIILGTILWWLGHWESVQPPVMIWFFHKDLTVDLLYLSSVVVCSALGFLALPMAVGFYVLCSVIMAFPLGVALVTPILYLTEQKNAPWAFIPALGLLIIGLMISALWFFVVDKVFAVFECMMTRAYHLIPKIIIDFIDAWKAGYTRRAEKNRFVYYILPCLSGLSLSVWMLLLIF